MSNLSFRQIDGEWEMTFGPTERSELERLAIAGVWHDAKDLDWICDLRPHHFRDPAAADGYAALMQCLRKYRRVEMPLVREILVGQDRHSSWTALLEQEKRGIITHSDVRSAAELIIEMEFRQRAWVAAQSILMDVQKRSMSIEEIRKRASTGIGQAFAGSDRRMAQPAQDVLLEYGDFLAGREDEQRQADESGAGLALLGIPTPFTNLNTLTSGGPTTAQVIYLGGWPGMGKSALAADIGLHMAEQMNCPGAVYYWTGEMGKAQMARRLAAKKRGVKIGNVRAADVYEASALMPEFYIDDDSEMDVDVLESRLQMHKVQCPGFKVAILDYVLLLGPNDHKELSALSRRLVRIAKNLDVLIIGLQQLKTELENRQDKRPRQSDLAECGQFQRDAGGIWMIHRPAAWSDSYKNKAEAYLFVRKNRDGPLGQVSLSWDAKTATYTEYIPVKRVQDGRELREPEDPQASFEWSDNDLKMMEDIPL